MGQEQSRFYSENDYELVIKTSKELEYLLGAHFNAEGRGLHEKINCVQSQLPQPLIKKMRRLATIRNKLIHERGFDRVPDRDNFIREFEVAAEELKTVVANRGRRASGPQEQCTIL